MSPGILLARPLRQLTRFRIRHGSGYAMGALNLGSDRNPDWCLNLRSNPQAWIEVDGHHRPVFAREAQDEEAEEIWGRFIEQLPQIRNTLSVARRHVPLMVLEPA